MEILPPLRGNNIQSIFDTIDPLMEFKPPFIDVTYHREEFVYKKTPEGFLEKKSIKKRPGTVGICAAIMNRYDVDAVPHIICGGFTKEETETALIDLQFLGIDNVLALRGDAIKNESHFSPENGGNNYAIDLVHQVVRMNKGQYLDTEVQNATPTNFCIGVAGYPEKHFEAPNMQSDMRHLKAKIDAGGSYIVTQMFFDNKKYFAFLEACRKEGITVPIIPGLKPITTRRQLAILPKTFSVEIPQDLVDAIEQCKDDKAVREAGIEWCIAQSKELVKEGAPVLHYYTMGSSYATKRVASEIF